MECVIEKLLGNLNKKMHDGEHARGVKPANSIARALRSREGKNEGLEARKMKAWGGVPLTFRKAGSALWGAEGLGECGCNSGPLGDATVLSGGQPRLPVDG